MDHAIDVKLLRGIGGIAFLYRLHTHTHREREREREREIHIHIDISRGKINYSQR